MVNKTLQNLRLWQINALMGFPLYVKFIITGPKVAKVLQNGFRLLPQIPSLAVNEPLRTFTSIDGKPYVLYGLHVTKDFVCYRNLPCLSGILLSVQLLRPYVSATTWLFMNVAAKYIDCWFFHRLAS